MYGGRVIARGRQSSGGKRASFSLAFAKALQARTMSESPGVR